MISAPVRWGGRPEPGPTRPAAASTAVADAVIAPPRPWRVLGVSTHACWCAAGDDVLVLIDDRAVRLPNAVVTGGRPGERIRGDAILVGGGRLDGGERQWRIVRWWDPQVAPVTTNRAVVGELLRSNRPRTGPYPDEGFGAALAARAPELALTRATALVGRGPGLTPEGDDYLTGAVAGFRHVGASVGDDGVLALLDVLRGPLLAAARAGTTRLSFSLLRHAFAGEVAGPVGALLRALTGRGDLRIALAATTAIGGTSGGALVDGVAAGAEAALGMGS